MLRVLEYETSSRVGSEGFTVTTVRPQEDRMMEREGSRELSLNDVYRFAAEQGLEREVNEIRNMSATLLHGVG